MTYLIKREKRNRANRGFVFRCENLMKHGLSSIRAYSFSRKLHAQKRMLLSQTIIKLD